MKRSGRDPVSIYLGFKELAGLEQREDLRESLLEGGTGPDLEADDSNAGSRPRERLRRPPFGSLLLDFQEDLAAQIVETCALPPPQNIGLVALPTGGGKTRTATCAVLDLMNRGTRSVLWLAPSRELLEQAVSTFSDLWARYPSQLSSLDLLRSQASGEFPVSALPTVHFATPQMLYRRAVDSPGRLPTWDLVVFDEAHLADAPTFRESLNVARTRGDKPCAAFGLSATPGRRDDRGTESLIDLFGRRLLTSAKLGKDAFETLQKKGVLARVDFRIIPSSRKPSGAEPALDPQRFGATVTLCEKLAAEGRTLLFAGSVAHAAALAVALRGRGVRAKHVSGRTPLGARASILRSFQEGSVDVLCNKSLLATGYDCPSIANVVLTVPVKSPILFEQIVGRASRGPAVGGNERSTAWYFDDHLKMHGKPASYQRYALSGWM